MLLGARLPGLLLLISSTAVGCLRVGYDALMSEEGGGSGGNGGGSGEAGQGASGGSSAGQASGGSSGGTAGASAGSAGGGTTSSGGSGGVPPPLPGPPLAAFWLSPPAGDTATVFDADASASADVEDAFSDLVFEWDWETDGSYDDTGPTITHTFATPGAYTVTLRVTDTDGNTGLASRNVTVVDPTNLLLVDIEADEDDNGATADVPGGTGLSLREAMTIANATAGLQLITFEPGLTVTLGFGLPVLGDVADVYGNGTAIDGSSLGGAGPCLRLLGTVRLFDLEVFGCPGAPIAIQGGSDSVVSGCYVHDNGTPVQSLNGDRNVIGPGNEITAHDDVGLYVNSPDSTVVGNFIHGNPAEPILTGGGAVNIEVSRNLLLGGSTSIRMAGDGATIWHNTFVGPADNGIELVNVAGIDLRNNIFVGGQFGISGTDADFAQQSHNLFFGHASGACSDCTPGAGTVEGDPLFIDAAAGDYRLAEGSPAIDAGIDVGEPFSGSAPDLGFSETAE